MWMTSSPEPPRRRDRLPTTGSVGERKVDKVTAISNTLIAKVQEIAQAARMAGQQREPLTLSPEASVVLAEFLAEALDAQAWFWTEEWQAGERAVDEYLAAGDTEEFSTMEEFLASLDTD